MSFEHFNKMACNRRLKLLCQTNLSKVAEMHIEAIISECGLGQTIKFNWQKDATPEFLEQVSAHGEISAENPFAFYYDEEVNAVTAVINENGRTFMMCFQYEKGEWGFLPVQAEMDSNGIKYHCPWGGFVDQEVLEEYTNCLGVQVRRVAATIRAMQIPNALETKSYTPTTGPVAMSSNIQPFKTGKTVHHVRIGEQFRDKKTRQGHVHSSHASPIGHTRKGSVFTNKYGTVVKRRACLVNGGPKGPQETHVTW